jgi:hypothetical protein
MLFKYYQISTQLKCKIFGIGIFLLFASKAEAAVGDSLLNGLNIDAKVQYGFVFPHHSLIEYLLNGNIHCFEVMASTGSNNRHPWESLYRSPRYGLGYNYSNYSNEEILGNAHAFFGFCEIPFFRPQKRFLANYKIDFGLAYNTKVFDSETNPLNHSISSKVNAYVGFDFNTEFRLNENHRIKAGLDLTHYSNGKMRSPNLGINTVTLSAAWSYSLVPMHNPSLERSTSTIFKKHIVEGILNFGLKRDDMLNERLYRINSFVGDYFYCLSPKYALGGGVDLFYDESLRLTREFQDNVLSEPKDNYQLGSHFAFMVRYGNFSIVLGMGHYLVASYHKYTPLYSRFGMRYAFCGKYMFNFTVKAHYAIADYIEWGFGYRFNTRGL